MLRLLLVRHGQTDWNAQHRYQGQTDIPLAGEGCAQARLLAGRLLSMKIDLAISSDLLRARQTAEILLAGRDISLTTDARLREMNFGMLEGHTFEEALQLWPGMISTWVADNNQPPEGGERLVDLNQRVMGFFSEISRDYPDKTVLIVSHGGPLREILQNILGSPPDDRILWISLAHAGLSDIQLDAENVIINCLNASAAFM